MARIPAKDPVALPDPLPPVFLSDSGTSQAVSRMVSAGRARKIGPKLYTTNMHDPIEEVVRRYHWAIVALVAPGTVIGYRTAFEAKPAPDGTVYVVGPVTRTIVLPGLTVRVLKGPGALEGDTQFLDTLFLASRARAILDGLRLTRERKFASRAIARASIEQYLERELQAGDIERLQALRDLARRLAPQLDAVAEFDRLDGMIGTLLGSRTSAMESDVAQARVRGKPYDPDRLTLFASLQAALAAWTTTARPDAGPSFDREFANLAFFDAYFSNVIEGTDFLVEEARAIVFDAVIPAHRPEDAHDVLGTSRLVGDRAWLSISVRDLTDVSAYLERMRAAHRELMALRPDKRPGEWKDLPNQAGNTHFVAPSLVEGTLRRGFEVARALDDPFARAAMVMFVVAEVHPFQDGNGRIARALMNAELVSAGQRRVFVPTVARLDYLTGLRTLSRSAHALPYLQVLDHLQEYVARLDASDYSTVLATLDRTHAFEQPTGAGTSVASDDSVPAKLVLPPRR